MSDIKALLREARLPEKIVEICLRGDLVAEYEAVEAEHDRAVENRGDSLAGGNIAELKHRMNELREQMTAGNVAFRLRAMPRPKWRALCDAHQPRKDEESGEVDARDRVLGVNVESFFEPLVMGCVIEPELDDEDWALLFGERLTDRQFDVLALAAWDLNKRDVDVPFSPSDSKGNQT